MAGRTLRMKHTPQVSYPMAVLQHLVLDRSGNSRDVAGVIPFDRLPEEMVTRLVPKGRDLKGVQKGRAIELLLDQKDNLWDLQGCSHRGGDQREP